MAKAQLVQIETNKVNKYHQIIRGLMSAQGPLYQLGCYEQAKQIDALKDWADKKLKEELKRQYR